MKSIFPVLAILFVFFSSSVYAIPFSPSQNTYEKGKIIDDQRVLLEDSKEVVTVENPQTPGGQTLEKGTQVFVLKTKNLEGNMEYQVFDRYRLGSLSYLFLGFFLLTIVLTGIRGVTSLLGLGFSILVIVGFIVPFILKGYNPLLICFSGGLIIAFVSLYFAHGFRMRTSLALAGMLITLFLVLVLSYVTVELMGLSGTGSEEAFYLQFGELGTINLRGLLLGGIMIGTLGVLDDVTTAQAAAVEELKMANARLRLKDLYQRAYSIGKEHITALVNTLALAYTGSSLPLLLLFSLGDQPFSVILNHEAIVEEIVRTLVGSSALILAVPITTFLAALYYAKKTVLKRSM